MSLPEFGGAPPRSLTQLLLDTATGLVFVVPRYIAHALAIGWPARLASHFPPPHEPAPFPPSSPTANLSADLACGPAIRISRRSLTVHGRQVDTEELSLPAAATSAAQPSSPPRPAVHLFLVTGNPGTVRFYRHFLAHLSRLSRRTLHLHSLSFAGHHSLDSLSPQPLYDLKDQTELWLAYLRDWLARQAEEGSGDSRAVLCGHSIGAWMALELVDRLRSKRIRHSLLLFPTLSQMANTPAGKRLKYPFAYGRPLLVSLAGLLAAVLPKAVLRAIVRFSLSVSPPPTASHLPRVELDDVTDTVVQLFSAPVVAQCMYLAHDELQTVVDERPAHTRLMAQGQATLFSGAADEWDPAWLQDERRQRIPSLREVRMPAEVKHAFVLGSSEQVAEAVWQELQRLHLFGLDLRTLSMDKLDEMLLKLGMGADEVAKLQRWDRVRAVSRMSVEEATPSDTPVMKGDHTQLRALLSSRRAKLVPTQANNHLSWHKLRVFLAQHLIVFALLVLL